MVPKYLNCDVKPKYLNWCGAKI